MIDNRFCVEENRNLLKDNVVALIAVITHFL